MLLPKRFTKYFRKQLGFTLIELIVVIGILAILLAIVLVAVNPAHQFSLANDTQRRSDVNAILNAVYQYSAEHKGSVPAAITSSPLVIKSVAGGADLCSTLTTTYIASMPFDPLTGSYTDCSTYNTGYTIQKSATNNRITVTATPEIAGVTISVTK